MADYDFTACLSALDFELLSKDLLEVQYGIQLENFSEGRDKGIDLRYAPIRSSRRTGFNLAKLGTQQKSPELIIQCKRYSKFSDLKSVLERKELSKIQALKPGRYILTTSVSLSPAQSDEIKRLLSPFVQSTGDIYGRDRLNSLLTSHPTIERRHIKLWATSAGVLDSIINAGTHLVSREEVERTLAAAKIYVRNDSFDEALEILKRERVCIISGLPGIGKTTLARMLLLYFYDQKFDVIKISGDISEARAVGYHSRPRFYYYDDFLGQTAQADKLNKNEDQRLLDFMASIRDSKDSVFVLTTREYILNQAKLHYEKLAREKFDHRTCIIDLSKYSRRIRAQILYNHLHFSKLPRSYLETLVAERGYINIVDHENYNPRLIEYLTDCAWIGNILPQKYLTEFLRKLDNPVDIWEHAFRNQLSDRARNLLFMLTTLPNEALLDDVGRSFEPFHNSHCTKFGIGKSSVDFTAALKELDGTFVATRKDVEGRILVRFQNPSIRDFMQYLLLGGELLQEVLNSLVFFEQALWFVQTLEDKSLQISRNHLPPFVPRIVAALQQLADSESCTYSVHGYPPTWRAYLERTDPAARIAAIASAISKYNIQSSNNWVIKRISELAIKVQSRELSTLPVVKIIDRLKDHGYLDSDVGKQLIIALKLRATSNPSDLDDFESIAKLVCALPELFDVSELESIRESFSDFAYDYSNESHISSPDELREEASRIGDIGNLLKVDTDEPQQMMSDTADNLESEEDSSWDSDGEGRGYGGNSDECSDHELDSIFSTLT